MYRPAGPTWKISKRTHAEIREIHRTLPVMLRVLLGESDVDGPGQGNARLASRDQIGRAKNAVRAAGYGDAGWLQWPELAGYVQIWENVL
jgi:hypothetical protein